jgi:hypothetical protein
MVIGVSRRVVTLTVDVTRLTRDRVHVFHLFGQLSVVYDAVEAYLAEILDSRILGYSSLLSRKRPKCGTVKAIWPRSAE